MIETARLLLRLPEPGDAVAVAEAFADPETMRWIGAGETGSYEDAVEAVARMRRAWELDGFERFSVVRHEDGMVIGRVGLLAWHPADWRNGLRAELGPEAEIELGWVLTRDYWGQGYATEAALAARDWALAEVRPRRLISLIHPANAASIRVAEKLGERYTREMVTARGVTVGLWELPTAEPGGRAGGSGSSA